MDSDSPTSSRAGEDSDWSIESKKNANHAFLDDLDAAIRLKSYLVGRGISVPSEVIKAIAFLESRYETEISMFKKSI